MSDTIKAQALAQRAGIQVLVAEKERLEGQLTVVKDDLANMRRELGALERFMEAEGITFPYDAKAGI